MTGVLIISVLFGFLLAELALRAITLSRLKTHFAGALVHLRAFHAARGDDARQQALMNSGIATLKTSLLMLAVTGTLLAIALLPILPLQWNSTQIATYCIATSAIATVWWLSSTKYRLTRSNLEP